MLFEKFTYYNCIVILQQRWYCFQYCLFVGVSVCQYRKFFMGARYSQKVVQVQQ